MSGAEIFALLGFIIAVIGSTFGVLAYLRPRKRQKLLYQTSGIQYFEEQEFALPPDFVMTFQGKNVKRLAKTTLILWSGGIDVLRGKDIVDEDPIRICLPENSKILRSTLVGQSNESNLTRIEQLPNSPNELAVKYDYLNFNDGAVIEVMHDGKQDDPTIIGAAKGLSGGPKGLGDVTFHDIEKPRRKTHRLFMMTILIAGVIVVVMSGTGWVFGSGWAVGILDFLSGGEFLPNSGSYGISVVFGIGGLIYMAMPTYVLWKSRRRYPKSLRRFLQAPGDTRDKAP